MIGYKFEVAFGPSCSRRSHTKKTNSHREFSVTALNDNWECFEQMVFDRAVRRELSGDVDFE